MAAIVFSLNYAYRNKTPNLIISYKARWRQFFGKEFVHGKRVFVHGILCKEKNLPNLVLKYSCEEVKKGMKCILHKGVDIALSMLAIIATIFANCQCTGRAYEPEVPEELK